jgi:peptidoglycan/LPS O-acetylase OafA/YrhL
VTARIPALDGLRGLAALCVLTFHVWLYRDGTPARVDRGDVVDSTLSSLRIALIFFFVLSGFLLARDLRRWLEEGVRAATLRRYAGRRARRILPAYWVSLAGALALVWGGSPEAGIRLPPAERLWAYVVLGQNHFADTVLRLNPVTWTLAVEVAFYALLPVLAAGLALMRVRSLAVAAVVLLAATLAVNLVAHLESWPLTARRSVLPYLGYFGLGMAVAWAAGRRDGPLGAATTPGLVCGGLAAVAATAAWQLSVARPGGDLGIGVLQHLPAGIGFAALVWAGAQGSGPAAAALSLRPLAALGVVSYGFFLWHVPILWALNRLGDWPGGALWAATAGLSLGAAALSWRLLERPLLKSPATLPRPWTSSRRSSSA